MCVWSRVTHYKACHVSHVRTCSTKEGSTGILQLFDSSSADKTFRTWNYREAVLHRYWSTVHGISDKQADSYSHCF